MTPEEINRLIAEKCMGWYISRNPYGGGPEAWLFIDPPETYEDHYCLAPFHRLADFDPYHNISHAMRALEKYRKDNPKYLIKLIFWPDGSTTCTVYPTTTAMRYITDKEADTPSAAISLAIVEAVKGE